MASREFEIQVVLVTECSEQETRALTAESIRRWVMEHFEGCDLGQVSVGKISEFGSMWSGVPIEKRR